MTLLDPHTSARSAKPAAGGARHRLARWGLLTELNDPRQVVANLTPNWFASVMGTGIVATAAASLPEQFPGLRIAATVVWGAAAVLLIALTIGMARRWIGYRQTARRDAADPLMAQFYGAVPMAILTVGDGTLLLGRDVIGLRAAVDIDWVMWLIGTPLGLACAVAVPYLMFTKHDLRPDSAFGGWLMPIVPPMVSATAGALLIPYAPAGPARASLLLCCYGMFGMTLLASLIVITLIWHRLTLYKIGPLRMVPTLWIVLGPLGQSITSANLLGNAAQGTLPAPYGQALQAFGVVYGVPALGFALLWATVAGLITVHAVRSRLPFSLTWWSFTFPVGTCVTGTSALALNTGLIMFRVTAAVIYAALVAAWLIVAIRTARDSIRGRLFQSAPAAQTPTAAVAAAA
jgi:C4-dicarboxylate transporter/malic acid transport protein